MKKQNFILTLIFIFSIFNNNFAQITISGTISDPNANLVSGALVEIYDNNDTLNTYSATTNASGFFQISNITNIKNIEKTIPSDYLILRNYPNPFNPSTIIYFELPYSENIDIKIFDILGREVRTLFSGFHYAGVDQISWDGRNNFNQTVSAGVYLCQLKTKNNFTVHKMVLLDGGTNSSSNFSHKKISNHNPQMPVNVNSRFNFTVKVTGDSLDATYFRNLVCTKDTTLNLIVSKIIKTETIGIAGGTVGNDDFKISIPAGAFDGNYNISLIKIEEDGAFGENTVTPSFKVSGVPKSYTKPLRVAAKYSGELSGLSFLKVGEMVFDPIIQDSKLFNNLNKAKDSLGYLVGEIPNDGLTTKSLLKIKVGEAIDLYVSGITGLKDTKSKHFKVTYLDGYTSNSELLLETF
ncbi:MAG: T9SS type A sorting domain-containing protein [Ignavibacteriales bacterium]|nr:T9SS type A sorting domain-containing protein [Ignavibacteriales bacterium]